MAQQGCDTMQLVIAEKPLLGKAIADAIPGKGKDAGPGIIEKQWQGDTIKIAWCFGHLLALKPPEEYDPKYKRWALEDLPIYFPGWEKQPPKGDASKQARVKQLGALLKEASCVIHAGDLDDEGQCIVDELLDYFKYRGPVKRLDTRDITPGALKHALSNMDDNAGHRPDGTAAYARQVCDALFGFNLSRYYTLINQDTKMTVGRVQTPALGLVVRRDMAIANHAKQMYYTLYVDVLINGVKVRAKFVPDKNNEHLQDGLILDKEYIQEVASRIAGQPLGPGEVLVTKSNEVTPLPFNTTQLNRYCRTHFGLSPIQVLEVTQSLRDAHKAIIYNRSECPYLSMELHKEAPGTIAAAAGNLGINTESYEFDSSLVSRAFDDSKVGAHMGIIPTAISIDVKAKFNENQKRVYEAIALHYLVQFLPPAKKEMTKLVIQLPGYGGLVATASSYIEPGYRVLLKGEQDKNEEEGENDTSKNDALRSVKPGSYPVTAQSSEVKAAETKPPAKYTQSTLAEDMTRIARYCTNAKVKELLLKKDKDKTGENGSIGTEATRPAIIAGLISHGLLREVAKGKKKYIEATEKGRELYAILPENIKGVDVTAKWWCLTEDIKLGQYTPEQMAQNVLLTVKAVISSGAGRIEGIERIAQNTSGPCLGKCPKCGGDVYETPKGYACTSPGCKFIMWKESKLFAAIGKQLTPKIASMFLSKGRVGLKNCKSAKKGTKFDTILVADFSGDRVQFNFEDSDSKEPVGKCPLCGADVLEKGQRLQCSSDRCEFVLWKSNHFLDSICKTLSSQEAATLMRTGRLEVKNAKSKKKGTIIKRCIVTVDFTQTPFKWGVEFPK